MGTGRRSTATVGTRRRRRRWRTISRRRRTRRTDGTEATTQEVVAATRLDTGHCRGVNLPAMALAVERMGKTHCYEP
jgi:hypothetical protein